MRIHVKLFAILKDRAGCGETSLDVREGASAREVADVLASQKPAIADFLPRVAYAVNLSYAKPDTVLHDGDELALIPPVSGG